MIMIDLIQKRHSGNGWHVFTELAYATGGRAERRADAVAVGLWPSNGYEIHGYEVKLTRSDLQRDLKDMTKSHAVGKYCDYWWLVVDADVNMDGLVIPKQWGLLVPKGQILRTVRKATKRKTVPIDRGFAAGMIRHATEKYVPLAQLKAVREELYQAKHASAAPANNDYALKELRREHDRLLETIKAFKEASGIDIHEAHPYRGKKFGEAAKLVVDLVDDYRRADTNLRYLSNIAERLHDMAGQATSSYEAFKAAVGVREVLDPPSFTHTRADRAYDPCPICLEQMTRGQLINLVKDKKACEADRLDSDGGVAAEPLLRE